MKSKDRQKARAAFNYVRVTFFPRWDPKKEWKLKLAPTLPSEAKCIAEKKAIMIRELEKTPDLYALLIHEICHSSSSSHGKKFFFRFRKRANMARELGFTELAQKIMDEVSIYQERQSRSTRKQIYQMEEDVLIANPETSYQELLNFIGKKFGMRPRELENYCKQFRERYEKLIWRRQATQRLKEAFYSGREEAMKEGSALIVPIDFSRDSR